MEESLSAAAETPPAFLLALRDTQTEAVVDEEQCFLYSIVYSAAVCTQPLEDTVKKLTHAFRFQYLISVGEILKPIVWAEQELSGWPLYRSV